jgi:hypothetical protein
MLSSLRRGGFVQIIMGTIVVLIIAGFAFTNTGRTGASMNLKDECVVKLDGDCVLARDFSASFRLAVPPDLEEKEIKAQGLRKQVVEGLVERVLLLRDAERLGISVSGEDVDAELQLGRVRYSLPVGSHALQMNRKFEIEANPMFTYIPVKSPNTDAFSWDVYKRSVLNYARMSTKDFKKKQRDELVASRMRALIMSEVRVAESEAFAQYQRENTKAIARVAHLDRDWFARFTVSPSSEAADKYATDHQDQVNAAWEAKKASFVPGCVDVREIEIAFEGATDDEKAEAKKKLGEAARRIKSGESFDLVARQISTAPSAAIGGHVGCIAKSDEADSKKINEALDKLAAGDVSDVIETDSGLRVIKAGKKIAEADLEAVGKKIVALELLVSDEADKKARAYAEQLIAAGRGGKALEEGVAALSKQFVENSGYEGAKKIVSAALAATNRPKVEISSSFSALENPVPEATNGSPAALVFGLEKVDDILPEPIATRQGLAVLQLKEKTAALREDFDKKKEELMANLRLLKQADALASYVRRLRAEAANKLKVDNRYFEEATTKAADEG